MATPPRPGTPLARLTALALALNNEWFPAAMIINVEDSGVLELFWRHPVSMRPNRRKALQFLSAFEPAIRHLRHIHAYLSMTGAQRSSAAAALDRLAEKIGSGEIVVLEQKGESRWPGSRLFVQPFSASILLLARTAADSARSDEQARGWLGEVEEAELQNVFKAMCIRYRRSAVLPTSGHECAAEIERLLDTGNLVPVYHPLPVYVETVVAGAPANPEPAPRPQNPPPPETNTFDSGHAGNEQAAALAGAAEDAAAVCELCNGARKARPAKQRTRKHWVEIQLVGEDGIPVPEVEYRITLPNGEVVTGRLDANGSARLDGIEQSGNCQVAFPGLDKREWKLCR